MTYIPLEPVANNEYLTAVGYDRSTMILRLTLVVGRTIDLPGVSPREVSALLAAPEIGKHYKKKIWPNYGMRTVQPNEMQPAD